MKFIIAAIILAVISLASIGCSAFESTPAEKAESEIRHEEIDAKIAAEQIFEDEWGYVNVSISRVVHIGGKEFQIYGTAGNETLCVIIENQEGDNFSFLPCP
jgi:hypothetical protein